MKKIGCAISPIFIAVSFAVEDQGEEVSNQKTFSRYSSGTLAPQKQRPKRVPMSGECLWPETQERTYSSASPRPYGLKPRQKKPQTNLSLEDK